MQLDPETLTALARDDRELKLKLGRLSARVRIGPSAAPLDVVIDQGNIVSVGAPAGTADVVIVAPDAFWEETLQRQPRYVANSLTIGASIDGDVERFVAPYYGAYERLLKLMRRAASGDPPAKAAVPDRRDTDDAVGRYAYVRNGDDEARVFYEEAGYGDVGLLLHATAGADARQWRHMLSYPPLRARFRMIAYDLPGHGRSLPPHTRAWWEEPYLPVREDFIGWATGMVETLALDRPIFLGCSVGGQLAIDLAMDKPEHFRALVSLNGWCSPSPAMYSSNNDIFRDPAVATEYYNGRVLGSTSPLAPEERRHEAAFIYRSNAHGIYAGDNDYFVNAHDLSKDGWRIDTTRTPLFVLAGEDDVTSFDPEHGAAAIPRCVPGAQYRLLPGLAHFAPSEDPERFCETITPILDEVLAACAALETSAA